MDVTAILIAALGVVSGGIGVELLRRRSNLAQAKKVEADTATTGLDNFDRLTNLVSQLLTTTKEHAIEIAVNQDTIGKQQVKVDAVERQIIEKDSIIKYQREENRELQELVQRLIARIDVLESLERECQKRLREIELKVNGK